MIANPDPKASDAQPGSDLYYSLLGMDSQRRSAIIACHDLASELKGIAEIKNGPAADAKAQWWNEELDRLTSGGAIRHQASQRIAPYISAYSLDGAEFKRMLDAAHRAQSYDIFPSAESMLAHSHASTGALAMVRATILGYEDSQTEAFAHDAGLAVGMLENLANTRLAASVGKVTIPQAEFDQFGLQPRDLLQSTNSAQLGALFAFQAERIRTLWNRAQSHLSPRDRYAQRQQTTLLVLMLAWLDEVEKDGFALLERKIVLTPIRKLWIAWTTLRRQQKNQRQGA